MNAIHLRNDKFEYRPKRPERLAGTDIFIAPVEGGYSKIQCTKWWDTFVEVEVGEAVIIDNKSLKGNRAGAFFSFNKIIINSLL